jgi:formate C-acetyltransferase
MSYVTIQKEAYESRQKEKIKKPFTIHYLEEYVNNLNLCPELREAKAFKKIYECCDIEIYPYELVVGRISMEEPVGFHIGCGTYLSYEAAEEYIKQNDLTQVQKNEFYKKLEAVKTHKYLNIWERGFYEVHPDMFTEAEINAINCGAACSTFFGGHMILDFDTMINNGLGWYKEQLDGYPDSDYYRALRITLETFQSLILRTANKCKELSESCEEVYQDNMISMAKELDHIAHHKPETFRQALQLVWFGHICNNSDSFGRFDKYLYPFYKSDIEKGLLTREHTLEILKSLMIKIDEQNQIQNMTIGGIISEGGQSYTELTQLILEATRIMGYKGPNLSIRINRDMPESFWKEINKNLSTGQGLPALYNEELIIKWLIDYGINKEDALDFCLGGCSQVNIPGRSQFVNDIGMMNAAKIFELTLYNGVDSGVSGESIGVQTGEAEAFESFEEFLEAYKEQLSYYSCLEASIHNKIVKYIGETEGYNLRSLFTRGCLEAGKGVFKGGARYNGIQLECIGITNAADSLAAVKKAVYDEKRCTISGLKKALISNFEGYEDLRLYLKNKVPKFGNDDDYVDLIRQDISAYLFDELKKHFWGAHIFRVKLYLLLMTGRAT